MTSTQLLLPGSRKHALILLAILIGAVSLRLFEFQGFGALDDAAYAQIAHQVVEGRFVPGGYSGPAVFPLRVGIIYPTALLFRYVGVSEATFVFVPFFFSILSVFLAYICTNHFFGPRAALLGAGVWALLPLDAFHASVLSPDLPGAFFSSLGVASLLILLGSDLRRPWTLVLPGVGIGALFGASWLCKESVVYTIPFCAILVLSTIRQDTKRSLTICAGVAIGSLSVLFGEMLVYHASTGDWLFHFHETERNYRQYRNAFFIEGSTLASAGGRAYLSAVIRRLLLTGPLTIFLNAQLLYLPLLAAIVCAHALYWRRRPFLLPGLWCGSLVFMFNFGSSSLTSYVPLVLFDRYLYPVLLPATIILAGFLNDLFLRDGPDQNRGAYRERFFWGALIAVLLLTTAGLKNYLNSRWQPGWVSETRAVSRILKPSDRLYTDILSIHGLEFFWTYPDNMNVVNFEDMPQSASIQGGDYVLVNRRYLNWLVEYEGWWPTKSAEYHKPAFASVAPASWSQVWSGDNAVLFRAK